MPNQYQKASSNMKVVEGVYYGDGVNPHNIDIGVDLTSVSLWIIEVHQLATYAFSFADSNMTTGKSMVSGVSSPADTGITGVYSSGFVLGDSLGGNKNGYQYCYRVMYLD